MTAFERPLVAVTNPTVAGANPGDRVPVREALVVTCSEHGELTDWRSIPERAQLQYQARQHAAEAHDGDVDAEGWVR